MLGQGLQLGGKCLLSICPSPCCVYHVFSLCFLARFSCSFQSLPFFHQLFTLSELALKAFKLYIITRVLPLLWQVLAIPKSIYSNYACTLTAGSITASETLEDDILYWQRASCKFCLMKQNYRSKGLVINNQQETN